MSQPPSDGPNPGQPGEQWPQQPPPWNQPQQGPPSQGQWNQPQQGQWNQPSQGQWGPPQQPQQGQWGPPEQSQPYGQPGTLTQPTKPRGRGKLIAGAAAVIVLAGGGVATYVAFSDSSGKGGAGSPKQAVQKLVGDLDNSDFLGLLDDLAPGEKRALADPVRDEIAQLKRLNVLQSTADPNKVSAVHVAATGLTFSAKTIAVNDHVQIVQLTAGKVTVNADATKVPLTKKFLDAAFPNGSIPTGSATNRTIDISQAIRKDGGKPIQIATEKVDGKWYPSLFYTIADYALASAHQGTPSAADRIPNKGASSADDAVRELITALSQQNYERAIELASPDELAVLHDYGQLIVQAAGSGSHPAPFTIKDIQFTHKDISGGQRLILKSLDVEAGGNHVRVAVANGCFDVTIGSDSKHMCANDLIDLVTSQLGRLGGQPQLTSAQRQAFTDLIDGVTNVGIDVSQSGGEWYVDAVRSYSDVVGSILSGLQGNDVYALIGFFRNLH
ncbi:MAG: hypothetical protein ACRDWT_21355 [Jatrophihabitantaceae bacterium]